MIHLKRMRPAYTHLLLLPIILLLLVGSLMLNRFYKNLTSNKIQEERRKLDALVYHTYFREIQRINLLLQAMVQLPGEEEPLMNSLLNMKSLYNGPGSKEPLLSTLGYFKTENPASFFYPDKQGEWESDSSAAMLPNSRKENGSSLKADETMIFTRTDGNSGNLRILFHHKPANQEKITVVLELDWGKFEELYISPPLNEILGDYLLKWETLEKPPADHRKKPEEGALPPEPYDQGDYAFHPLRALFNQHGEIRNDHKAILPLPLIPQKPIILNHRFGSEEKNQRMQDDDFFFKLDRNPFEYSGRVLSIGYKDGPFYKNIEKQYALNWLQSMFILIGIALIFFIAVIQLIRLRKLREQEKEFVASMTHELRTPLTVIQSAADNLAEGIIPPERINRYGDLIREQVLRLGNMVEEILQFSRMEGKPTRSDPVEMNLTEIIETTVRSVESIAGKKGILVILEEKVPEGRCTGDPDTIRLGLNNLLMNTVNHAYGGTGGPVRLKIKTGIPDSLTIIVEDEGRGIPQGEQKKVFNPFYRGQFSREHQEKGSGLGLFILLKRAAAAGGTLKLESPYRKMDGTKQQGCRFILKLPCTFNIDSEDGK